MYRIALQSTLSHYLFIIFFSFYHHAIGKNLGTLPNDIDISKSPNGIVRIPENIDDIFKDFDRYSKIHAPNGKPIHIIVEPGYSDRQVLYARKVLINHLTNLPNTKYGHDKTTIANAMANNQSILFLFKDTKSFKAWLEKLRRRALILMGKI